MPLIKQPLQTEDGLVGDTKQQSHSKNGILSKQSSGKEVEHLPEVKETDYCSQHNDKYRHKMIGRYAYLFNKPTKEMEPFEIALKYFLRFEGYQSIGLIQDDDIIQWEAMRRIENRADMMLQSMNIPYSLIQDFALMEKSADRRVIIKKNFIAEEMDVYI